MINLTKFNSYGNVHKKTYLVSLIKEKIKMLSLKGYTKICKNALEKFKIKKFTILLINLLSALEDVNIYLYFFFYFIFLKRFVIN
jgi:hypothetical protein